MGAVAAIRAPPAALAAMPALEPIYGALLPYSRVSYGLLRPHWYTGTSVTVRMLQERERERERDVMTVTDKCREQGYAATFTTTIHTLFLRSMATAFKQS